jgi:hypothetical protein
MMEYYEIRDIGAAQPSHLARVDSEKAIPEQWVPHAKEWVKQEWLLDYIDGHGGESGSRLIDESTAEQLKTKVADLSPASYAEAKNKKPVEAPGKPAAK